MSRIGKKGITIPKQTEINVSGDLISVKGSQGEITKKFPASVAVVVSDGVATVNPKADTIEARALWGTYASHIANMIEGVNKPFERKLQLEGIGYKMEVKGEKIGFALGFSHPVEVAIPKGIKVSIEKNIMTVSGVDKEMVGEFASKLRAMKKPEPYKGKGLRYFGEVVKIKQGKKSV
ncbi:MAG: 50S ribosomal protein L6 [Candidatus Zambryskibacteria bacterium RIFCSPHIGHO2_01_FULL_43_27]|uniref:50S ribosomal protein L6 n=1 Tax=Candidatus Zambryskibacteria bacterium RIFCSPLOWO2_01_FULL_43_17 TaxID=1802760 RepID=A0A1G2U433_9BACT|nr:MAG: 50S ribosomal protein L6 [Candidatus Zambryskibacteria bacterium RIFCSPHIGHO2_01_FULL_43_27]OHB00029.1 MAG: 50S ribosomal protein L6 [Candidatus Zambryskibacteria bacterium RIFCSPHIGHO2_12_FULL_43_12b]OHB04261.1 MAG: 50S ribosomal protein L6 [Candidatus Zambryskibacteria bacterium RIFCSPLOWO2_01_FULL_43_17]